MPEAFCEPFSGGVCAYSEPGSPLNKVAGIGMGHCIDVAELERIESLYRERACPVQVELATHADPSVAQTLTRRGYVLTGFEDVLGRDLTEVVVTAPIPGVTIETSDADGLAEWLSIVAHGFATPDGVGAPSHESFSTDVLERIMGDMASSQGATRMLARREGAPAGGASVRMSDGVAQLCGAATLPAHRRKGVQAALLRARLSRAHAAGCDIAVVTTQPGSTSHMNVRKQGFELLYSRSILVKSDSA